MGMAMAPATESIMGSLPKAKAGVGSAVNDTTREVGGALGVAVLGSLLAASYHSSMNSSAALQALPASSAAVAHDSLGGAIHVANSLGAAGPEPDGRCQQRLRRRHGHVGAGGRRCGRRRRRDRPDLAAGPGTSPVDESDEVIELDVLAD